jgi:hypothetical protein
VFTRGSSATVVGSDGLVQFAPNNLALYSGQLVIGTGWAANTTPSVTSIVDGLGPDGNNAYEVTEIANTGTHVLFNTGGTGTSGATSVVSGTTYTGSIFIKKVAVSVDWIQLSFSTVGFGSDQYANFNISNGTVGNFSSSSPQIQDAGNGWYRCSISVVATATTTTTSNLFLAFTNNTDTTSRLLSYAGSTANKILAAMCQFEIGSTVRPYNQTTTAVFYGPRFDHDPVTLACKGLLIEESRTNQIIQSEDFGTTWSTDGGRVAVATNVIASPSGATTADKITENNIILDRRILIGGVTAVASTVYTYSCFLKAGERDVAQLAFGGIFGNQYQNFIIGGVNAGALGSGSGITSPQIIALPNGWYRCTATITSAGAGATQVTIGPADSSTLGKWGAYLGTVGSGIYAWGAQLEAGAFPTSYIPTTTASVVRSADVCSITGSDFTGFYNQSEGTVYTESRPATVNGTTTTFGLSNGTSNERWLNRFAQNEQVTVTSAGTESGFDALNPVAGTLYKAATAGKLNDFAMSINGLAVVTDTSQPMPVVDRAGIGNPIGLFAGGGAVTIASIRYFRKRLPNAKLQTITV